MTTLLDTLSLHDALPIFSGHINITSTQEDVDNHLLDFFSRPSGPGDVLQIPGGVCQCSWNMSHAASSSLCTWITVVSFSGFSQTLPTGCQFRVLPDQRAGC